MPRRKFIDKKNATTYALVHRAQNDPLINDEDAPSMVFTEKQQSQRPRRPTEDDYIYSDAASVISDDAPYRSAKTKQRGDLEEEFGLAVRANEGEAAQHGVFFDDTAYDYMQHMRDLGTGEGAVTWVEASGPKRQAQRKGKQKLEDALRSMDLGQREDDGRFDDAVSVGTHNTTSTSASTRSLIPEEMFGSDFVKPRSYQDQQDVPDEIAGFQPDMDLRVREMLEALEDEAYVDDEEEDFFNELIEDGLEYERDEWEEMGERLWDSEDVHANSRDLEDAASDSEDTVRASSPPPALDLSTEELAEPPEDVQAIPPADPTDGAWLEEYNKFQSKSKSGATPSPAAADAPSALESSALSSLAAGRKKKRKGAKTSTTNYSMTSSALARTDQQTLLDDRFDKIEAAYAADEFPEVEEGQFDDALSSFSGATGLSNASKASRVSRYSAMSGASRASNASRVSSYSRATDSEAPQLQRTDFDSIMDEFLGGYSKSGKMGRRVKRGAPQSGMEQLDEIRSGLGPARIKSKTAARVT